MIFSHWHISLVQTAYNFVLHQWFYSPLTVVLWGCTLPRDHHCLVLWILHRTVTHPLLPWPCHNGPMPEGTWAHLSRLLHHPRISLPQTTLVFLYFSVPSVIHIHDHSFHNHYGKPPSTHPVSHPVSYIITHNSTCSNLFPSPSSSSLPTAPCFLRCIVDNHTVQNYSCDVWNSGRGRHGVVLHWKWNIIETSVTNLIVALLV